MKRIKTNQIKKKAEKGQSLVEFAFMAVILILLVSGIVDLGRAYFTYISLRDAAQEGAVYGSICPTNLTNIINQAKSSSNTPVDLANDPNVSITCKYENGATCGTGTAVPGSEIIVKVTYSNFMITMPFLGGVIGTQQLTISAQEHDTILRNKTCT